MKQQIRKPENWQDFEELCKMLWGEIWDCAEIKKNGRTGQQQHGVDVFGIPRGAKGYYGIQCKGKDEYTNATLTEAEINSELEKAKSFKPLLKKLYFATTANKDSHIEEIVRLKNVEHLEKELFEVHLFCWEDIAYLIDQNKKTHNWYVRKIDFASRFKVGVTFENDLSVKEYHPKLIKHYVQHRYEKDSSHISLNLLLHQRSPGQIRKDRIRIDTEPQPVRYYVNGKVNNKSSCVFSVKVKNTGNEQLENLKLYLTFNDECYSSEKVFKQFKFLDKEVYEYNINWIPRTNNLEFKPINNILVQDDELLSDRICLRPNIEYSFCLIIPWKLVAKDFNQQGELRMLINTHVEVKSSTLTVSEKLDDEIILENFT
jgi:hypothetical protein